MLGRAILFVKDLDRMVAFYETGLELPARRRDPGLVVLGDRGMELGNVIQISATSS